MLLSLKKLNLFKKAFLCLLVTLSILALLTSCTRNSTSSSVSIQIPGASGLSQSVGPMVVASDLKHIIINASVPGKPTVLWTWEQSQPPAPPKPIPNQAIMLIDKSTGVFFQALMVYEDSTTAVLTFKYADAKTDLATENVTVVLAPETVGGASPKEYTIAGRYINGVNGTGSCVNPTTGFCGPTGTLRVQFQPSGNKPKMLIAREHILNGWFNIFGIDGGDALFTYTIEETGQDILKDIKISAPISSEIAAADYRVHIDVPLHYQDEGMGSRKIRPATRMVYGFFASNATIESSISTNRVCYDNGAAINISNLYSAPTGGAAIQYVYNGGAPTIHVFSGGIANLSSCSGANELKTQLQVIPQRFKNGVDSRWASYQSIYVNQFDANNNSFKFAINYIKDTKNLIIKWNKIPGIDEGISGIDGVDFLINKAPSQDKYYDNTCSQLTSLGYSVAATIPISENLASILNIEKKDLFLYKVIPCPYKNSAFGKLYYGPGEHLLMSNGLPQNGILQVKKATITAPDTLQINTCEPLRVVSQGWNGVPVAAPAGDITTFTANTTRGKLFSDSNCTSPLTGFSITAGATFRAIYSKSELPGTIEVTARHGSNQYDSLVFKGAVSTNVSTATSSIELQSYPAVIDVTTDDCTRLEVTLHRQPVPHALTFPSADHQVTYSTSRSGNLYSDQKCTTVIPENTASNSLLYSFVSGSPDVGDGIKEVYYKAAAADVGSTDIVTFDNGSSTIASNIAVTSSVFNRFKIKTSTGTTLPSVCTPAWLESVNTEGLPIKRSSATVLISEITGPESVLASLVNCSSAAASLNVLIPANSSTSEVFYIDPTSFNSLTFSAVIGASANYLSTDGLIDSEPAGITMLNSGGSTMPTITDTTCKQIKVGTFTTAPSPLTVTDDFEVYFFYDGGTSNVKFYSDAGCTTLESRTHRTVQKGASMSDLIYVQAQPSTPSTNIVAKLKLKNNPNLLTSPALNVNVP